jgi:hypothetical protein
MDNEDDDDEEITDRAVQPFSAPAVRRAGGSEAQGSDWGRVTLRDVEG